MATDLLGALAEAWAADGTLAGIGSLHLGVDPESGYPFAVVSNLGTRIKHRNFGHSQVHEMHVRVNVTSDNEDEAATLGKLARAFLERLQANPLTFDEGRLIDSHQTGEDLVLTKPRKAGAGGQPFVWIYSVTWQFSTVRDRA
jgi:hypothetical protein